MERRFEITACPNKHKKRRKWDDYTLAVDAKRLRVFEAGGGRLVAELPRTPACDEMTEGGELELDDWIINLERELENNSGTSSCSGVSSQPSAPLQARPLAMRRSSSTAASRPSQPTRVKENDGPRSNADIMRMFDAEEEENEAAAPNELVTVETDDNANKFQPSQCTTYLPPQPRRLPISTSSTRPSLDSHRQHPQEQHRRVRYSYSFRDLASYKSCMSSAFEEELWRVIQEARATVTGSSSKFHAVIDYNAKNRKWYARIKGLKSKDNSQGDIYAVRIPRGGGTHDAEWLVESQWYGVSNASGAVEVRPLPLGFLTPFPRRAIECEVEKVPANCRLESFLLRSLLQGEGLTTDANGAPKRVRKALRDALGNPSLVVVGSELGGEARGGSDDFPPFMERAFEEVVRRFRLNDDQSGFVRDATRRVFLSSSETEVAPLGEHIALLEGPFGCGKTTLICACIVLARTIIDARRENDDDGESTVFRGEVRFGVTSLTNAAVDNLLLALLDRCEFDSVARIGSVKTTSRRLLPRMIHVGDEELEEAERDLHQLHHRPSYSSSSSSSVPQQHQDDDEGEVGLIQAAIRGLRDEATRRRNEEAFVVGFTIHSCSQERSMRRVFGGDTGDTRTPAIKKVLFVDEASQILEPLTLVPIAAVDPDLLVLVGDPKQLPPVSPFARKIPTPEESSSTTSLDSTLFDRLSRSYAPHFLRESYRCRPEITALASRLFYDGRVVSAASVSSSSLPTLDSRHPSCLSRLPPVARVGVAQGHETRTPTGSFYNDGECATIQRLLRWILAPCSSGETPDTSTPLSVSVITLYAAQATRLWERYLATDPLFRGVRVATVDSFQGGESDVVVISTVRSPFLGSSFTDSKERVNVAITRAKKRLVLVGDVPPHEGSLWGSIFAAAERFELD